MSIISVKYLYKYVYKGHDRAAITTTQQRVGDGDPELQGRDEITDYVDGRYVGPHEAIWRLFGFSLHGNSPTVVRLQCHLPNHQLITFNPETDTIRDIVSSETSHRTTLTEFFTACRQYPTETCGLTYDRMPEYFTWKNNDKTWSPRKDGFAYGRVYFVSPSAGERYYLRMLLCTVPNPTSFQSLRTVNDIVYPNFKAACAALGLLASDDEYKFCLTEAAAMQTGRQLRRLFATILLDCNPRNPQSLWDKFWRSITDDCKYMLEKHGMPSSEITDAHIQSYGLIQLDNQLQLSGKSLPDFHLRRPSINIDIADLEERKSSPRNYRTTNPYFDKN
jgi:hypothetical protein